MVFTLVGSFPPHAIPRVLDPAAEKEALAADKFPKSEASPDVAIVI